MTQTSPTRHHVVVSSGQDESDFPPAAAFDGQLPYDLEFEPVASRTNQADSITPARQRAFIAMLAQTGSVKTACTAVGVSSPGINNLRHRPDSESFAAAWDKAISRGARRVLDVMIDHAINGVPEYIYKDGEMVGERRHFNTRAMMWIVAHNFPEKYGVAGGLMNGVANPVGLKRLKAQWRAEWDAEQIPGRMEDIREDILTKIRAIQRPGMIEILRDPRRRSAYECLHGPTDWQEVAGQFADGPAEPWTEEADPLPQDEDA